MQFLQQTLQPYGGSSDQSQMVPQQFSATSANAPQPQPQAPLFSGMSAATGLPQHPAAPFGGVGANPLDHLGFMANANPISVLNSLLVANRANVPAPVASQVAAVLPHAFHPQPALTVQNQLWSSAGDTSRSINLNPQSVGFRPPLPALVHDANPVVRPLNVNHMQPPRLSLNATPMQQPGRVGAAPGPSHGAANSHVNPLGDILGDLYRQDEMLRRRDPFYAQLTTELFDLSIVLPVSIPYGDIVVDSPSGQNFYEFGKGHAGAQLLFGRPKRVASTDNQKVVEINSTPAPASKQGDEPKVHEGEGQPASDENKNESNVVNTDENKNESNVVNTDENRKLGETAKKTDESTTEESGKGQDTTPAKETSEPTATENGASDEKKGSSISGTAASAENQPKSENTESDVNDQQMGKDTAKETSAEKTAVENKANTADGESMPDFQGVGGGSGPLCDTWASFLHVHLGTIYNVPSESVPMICSMFASAFDEQSCIFYVPVTLNCQGVYRCEDDSLSTRGIAATSDKCHKYETRGKLVTENDKARFRMIRRYLKKFARDVMLACRSTPDDAIRLPAGCAAAPPLPRVRVELHANCRSSSLAGGIRVLIREFSELESDMQKLVESPPTDGRSRGNSLAAAVAAGRSAPPTGDAAGATGTLGSALDLVSGKGMVGSSSIHEWSARVMLGEIRLEHMRLRMVDPRWPSELVMGRRIADWSPELEVPRAGDVRARFVFCDRIEQSVVRYNFTNRTRDGLVRGRLVAILWAHMTEHPQANAAYQKMVTAGGRDWEERRGGGGGGGGRGGRGRRVMTNSTDYTPKNKGNNLMALFGGENAKQQFFSPSSAATTPSVSNAYWMEGQNGGGGGRGPWNPSPAKRAISKEPCRYFLLGGCARGDTCFYLHSADPKLECPVDVRQVRENQHPKFF